MVILMYHIEAILRRCFPYIFVCVSNLYKILLYLQKRILLCKNSLDNSSSLYCSQVRSINCLPAFPKMPEFSFKKFYIVNIIILVFVASSFLLAFLSLKVPCAHLGFFFFITTQMGTNPEEFDMNIWLESTSFKAYAQTTFL